MDKERFRIILTLTLLFAIAPYRNANFMRSVNYFCDKNFKNIFTKHTL